MPFTPAHPAAVLALRRLGLPTTALVVGSMVPDLPLFVPVGPGYRVTHSVGGLLTFDVVAGLALLAVWFLALRDAAVDLAPDAVRSRLAPTARPDLRGWLLAVPALVVGAVTHVVWDAFTHDRRWGTELVPWLAERHGGETGAHLLQYLSGVVGLAVVTVAAVVHLARLPRRLDPRAPRRMPGRASACVLAAPFVVAGAMGLVAVVTMAPVGWEAMAYAGVVTAIGTGLVMVVVVAAAWHARVDVSN